MARNKDELFVSRAGYPLRSPLRPSVHIQHTTDCLDTDDITSRHQLSSRTPFPASSSSSNGLSLLPQGRLYDQDHLFPHGADYTRAGIQISPCSAASATPIPSRSSSPAPLYVQSSSCSSEEDSDHEPDSPLMLSPSLSRQRGGPQWWRVPGHSSPRRQHRRGPVSWLRRSRRMVRKCLRLPFIPKTPITIILTLAFLTTFGVSLTFLLIYILNPDKEPLPWRGYCTIPPISSAPPSSAMPPTASFPLSPPHNFTPLVFPPDNFDSLSPAGVFVGVLTTDASIERRMMIRSTWASHPRSRNGAGEGDNGVGTSRTIVRFILGQPRKDWERRIQLEMQMYKDIVILPIPENMNNGKTHAYFSWATEHAWVPPLSSGPWSPIALGLSYANLTSPAPELASHDPFHPHQSYLGGVRRSWVRPDFVVKVDDDSFVMLAELEARLRVELHAMPRNVTARSAAEARDIEDDTSIRNQLPGFVFRASADAAKTPPAPAPRSVDQDPLIYWGYLVKNRFMAGELYALSWSLVTWVAHDPHLKAMARGAEDKVTSKWMRAHPRAEDIRWASERCWIYDHPRAGTVYSHGFLFPSEVKRVQRDILLDLKQFWSRERDPPSDPQSPVGGIVASSPFGPYGTFPTWWSRSTVSSFGVRYSFPTPSNELIIGQSVEALVEGSEMSKFIKEPGSIGPSWQYREGRRKRYDGKRLGGTVVVHYIKKNMWFLEAAAAFLEGDEVTEMERIQTEARRAEFENVILGADKYISLVYP